MEARERFARFGATRFGDAELLALILGTGEGAAAEAARVLLDRFGGLTGLASAGVAEVLDVPGVSRARAVQVLAALQAGRRSLLPSEHRVPINTSTDAYAQLYAEMSGQPHEMLFALYLNRRKVLLGVEKLTIGCDSYTIVELRQVYRPAVRMGAAAVVVAHNHPSGDPEPSSQDLMVTHRLTEAGELLGIELLDHLVVGSGRYVSLAERGLLRPPRSAPMRIPA